MLSRTFLIVNYRVFPKPNFINQKKVCCRYLHAVTQKKLTNNCIIYTTKKHRFLTPIINITCRQKSEFNSENNDISNSLKSEEIESVDVYQTIESEDLENVFTKIPEPPVPVQPDILEVVGEPSLHSLGLGSWYPPGIIQQFLEILHINANMPWWATIAFTTVCVKFLILPLNIKMQRNTTKMQQILPQIQSIQQKITEARLMNNQLEVVKLTYILNDCMKKTGPGSLLPLLLPLIQGPIFISFFYGIRGMIQYPVDSMKYGGLWWFENLTVPDKYYILPILTSATLSLTIELCADKLNVHVGGIMKYLIRSMPYIMFPFIINFDSATLCYWLTTNVFSLVQVTVLKMPKVKSYLQIPELKVEHSKLPPLKTKSFTEGFNDAWQNIKFARKLQNRQLYDSFVFEKAGKGPVPKTYKTNPLESKKNSINLSKTIKKF